MHDREFSYTQADFERVCRLLYQWAGIKLSEAKKDMVYSRLVRQIRLYSVHSFREYLDQVECAPVKDRQSFINSLTTNLTSFFRENHHFERLKEWLEHGLQHKDRISIWCTAASTGEEPYSIAMTVCEYFNTLTPNFELLASDLDTNVLNVGKAGIYSMDRVSKMSEERLKKFFLKGNGENENNVKVRKELQKLIRFEQINLLEADWKMLGNKKFDAIFCRNVMIYFDRETQEKLVRHLRTYLHSDGLLFVGHSESLHYATDCFKSLGNTVYKPI
ncbi:MAG: CheR family methyltransferase [Pseudomonadota bacterium]